MTTVPKELLMRCAEFLDMTKGYSTEELATWIDEKRSLKKALKAAIDQPEPGPRKLDIPPAPVDPLEVVYAEGWNAACDAFFGGLPPQEPLIITVTQLAQPDQPLTDDQIDAITVAQWGEQIGAMLAAYRAYARAIEAAHKIGVQP